MLPSQSVEGDSQIKSLTDFVLAAARGDYSQPLLGNAEGEWLQLEQAVERLIHELREMRESLPQHETWEKELKIARAIQASLLPSRAPVVPGLEIEAIYRPAQEIGGDYYDFIEVDPDHLGIGIADVSGKSVSGAMFMTLVRNTLRSQAMLTLSPVEVLERTHKLLMPNLMEGLFVSVFYSVLDKMTFTLKCANAGHLPLLWFHAERGSYEWVRPQGIAFGLSRKGFFPPMREGQVHLDQGDSLLFYTDGVTETRDPSGNLFGRERLAQWIESSQGIGRKILQSLEGELKKFCSGIPPPDDITAVVLQRTTGGVHG